MSRTEQYDQSLTKFSDEFTRIAESCGIIPGYEIAKADYILRNAKSAIKTTIGSQKRLELEEEFKNKLAVLLLGCGYGSQINLSQPFSLFSGELELPEIRYYTSQLLADSKNPGLIKGYFRGSVTKDGQMEGELFRNQEMIGTEDFLTNLSTIRISVVEDDNTRKNMLDCNYGSIPDHMYFERSGVKGIIVETNSPGRNRRLALSMALKQLRQKLRIS